MRGFHALLLFSECRRSGVVYAFEGFYEIAQVIEAAFKSNFCYGFVGFGEFLDCTVNSVGNEIFHGGFVCHGFEE